MRVMGCKACSETVLHGQAPPAGAVPWRGLGRLAQGGRESNHVNLPRSQRIPTLKSAHQHTRSI